MDHQAANLLSLLKRSAQTEQKIASLNELKSDIKHYRVPENATATIFECLKLSITQQASSNLASTAFSTLGHLIKRLKIQDASGHTISHLAPRLFPALQERLGDLREPLRSAASQALGDLYHFCGTEVEQIIREEAIPSSNARTKEAGMRWVVRMHKEEGMAFKGYVGSIVARLEDADGNVREAAKSVLIELFATASDRAKLDLKRQLKAYSVRHSIAAQILSQIDAESSSRPQTADKPESTPEPTVSTRSLPTFDMQLAEAINSDAAQPPPQEAVPMDPMYLQTRIELEDIFQDMRPHFDGKETEHNWIPRDKSILKLRRILKGNAPNEFHNPFMAGIKSMVEGILKVATSLRTTMATNGCQLVQELARTLGPALDKEVEILLQTFIKMTATTKHIAAEHGRLTASEIFQNCSYNVRMMQHIWLAAQEKNVQQRQCTPGWLQIILKRQASYKHNFESSGGLELAEKCMKKGLDDANPKVKESYRATYWTFAKSWPDKAEAIMSKLDPKSKAALERDPNNPNAALFGSASTSTNTRTGSVQSRNTLRELVAEQRKAKAAGKLPSRPNSAMADLSPAKQRPAATSGTTRGPSNLSKVTNRNVSTASTASASAGPAESSTATKKGSSLMSGPVRRPRRPEVPRPQTADPYASRRMLRPMTPANESPSGSPQRGTGASKASVASSVASRTESRVPILGNSGGSPVKRSPVLTRGFHQNGTDSRPTSKGSTMTNGEPSVREDDLTMVTTADSVRTARGAFSPGHKRSGLGQTMSVDSGRTALADDEDNFTMVMPNLSNIQPRNRSPLAYRSPMKAMFDDARENVGKLSPEAEQHMRKPELVSDDIQSQGGPVKTATPQPEEVRIYEDPFTEDSTQSGALDERKVLGELPVNENVRLNSPTQSVTSNTSPAGSPRQAAIAPLPTISTPQDRSEVMRNRKLLVSGIERIRTKTLDAHGFRKIQDVVKSKTDIWDGGQKYNELMGSVLEYLETFEDDSKLTQQPIKASGLKAQALGLVRALLAIYKKDAVAWHARSLVTVLICRKGVDSSNHIVADMQRTADEIISEADPGACMDAILDFVPDATHDATTARSTAMGLTVLRQLIISARSKATEFGVERRTRLAHTTAKHLNDPDPEVRKVDVDLASELFEVFDEPKTEFWTAFKDVDESRLGLLTYYIAKKGKAAAQ